MPNMILLSTSARRAPAASIIDAAAEVGPGPALLLADVLDGASAGILRAAGLSDDDAKSILAALWDVR